MIEKEPISNYEVLQIIKRYNNKQPIETICKMVKVNIDVVKEIINKYNSININGQIILSHTFTYKCNDKKQ